MSNSFGDFGTRYAIHLSILQVMLERGVRNTLAHKGCNGYEASVPKAKEVITAPHLTEKDIVIQVGELWSERTELLSRPAV